MSENLSSNYPLDLDQPRGRQFYWTVATLLIICSVGSVVGRIMQSESIRNDQSVPFFSANDRSRWCTVRSLVDKRTYAIDEIVNGKDADTWDTIDKVRHLGEDGEFHYYSSKPTLLPTLMAGKYWVLKKITGKSIAEHPFFVHSLVIGINQWPGVAIWTVHACPDRYVLHGSTWCCPICIDRRLFWHLRHSLCHLIHQSSSGGILHDGDSVRPGSRLDEQGKNWRFGSLYGLDCLPGYWRPLTCRVFLWQRSPCSSVRSVLSHGRFLDLFPRFS